MGLTSRYRRTAVNASTAVMFCLSIKVVEGLGIQSNEIVYYRKVASSNMSRLEAHAGFFRLLMKGIFDPNMYCDLLTKS